MSQLLALYMGSLILRSIGIALIAGLLSWKVRNVAVRHAIWVVVLGSMLLMPAVDYLLPASWVPVRIQHIASEQSVSFRSPSARAAGVPQTPAPAPAAVKLPSRPSPVNLWNVAATLYALVAFAMFIRLPLGYRKIRKLRRNGRTIASPAWEEIIASHRARLRLPVLLESEAVRVPMTVGLVRPAVILPADWKTWDDSKMKAVLLHEIAHVRRGDWGIAVMAAGAKCAYWLNPLFWFLERKLSHLAELASDDASLAGTENTARYAEILLEFAATTQSGGRLMNGGIAMAQHNMKARIERVLGSPQSGTGFVRIAGWALVMVLAIPVIYAAAALQVKSEPVKSPETIYSVEFGRNTSSPPPVAGPQATLQSAPVTKAKVQQSSPDPGVDPRTLYQQMEVVKQQLQQANKANEYFQEVQKYKQDIAGGIQEHQIAIDKSVNLDEALEKLEASIDKLNRWAEGQRIVTPSLARTDTKSGNRIFVTGKVQKPGPFDSDAPLTVLQALALAGGFQDYAKPETISIIRMKGNTSTLFHFNYSEVIRGVNTSQNIYLSDGDVVAVP